MSELRDRLNKVANRLEELENNPSELTRDGFLADLRDLYDAAKQTSVTGVKKNPTAAVKEEVVEEKVVEPEPAETETEAMPRPAAEVVTPLNETNEEPVEREDEITHPQDEKTERPFIPDAPVFEEVEEAKSAKDSILAQRRSLIGTIEESEKPNDDKILAGQLNNKPLEDLRTGIPLNEKFGIIRGLFNGNASDFGDAVLKLNNAGSSDEMSHYLGLLEKRFGWDVDSEPYITFLSYIERKMMTLQVSNADSN